MDDLVLTKSAEAWCAEKKTAHWLFAAARQREGWAIGRLLTEHDYDAGITGAARVTLSSPTIRNRRVR